MRDLAAYAMRGPKQAAVLATLFTAIPMMFWLGAALIALVTLRQGVKEGASVLVWSIIPALGWWIGLQDPGALIVLINTLVMASVLRYSISWHKAFVSGALVSLLVGILAPMLMPELIDLLVGMADQMFRNLATDAGVEYDPAIQASFQSLMVASFAASFYAMALASLCLARSWQSKLYHPGGWQQEFHQFRLSPGMVLVFLLLMVGAPYIGVDLSLVMLIGMVPVFICGLALVHGVIGKKKLGGQWLFGFYILAVMLFPTILMILAMLAIVDSAIDFRSRVQAVQD